MKKISVIDFIQTGGYITEVRVRLPQGQTFNGEADHWLEWSDWEALVASGQVEIDVPEGIFGGAFEKEVT